MKNKKAGKIILVLLLILPAIAFAHFMIFPHETRCILIGFSEFDKTGNIYHKNITPEKLTHLQKIIDSAENNDRLFWNENVKFDYKLIFCSNEKDFNEYAPAGAPAATYMKLGAYIVIKEESLDVNIIAHEISHTILYRNIGWYKRTFIIPTWFDEGLAMQVDDRDYYSIDTLLKKKNTGVQIPDVTKLKKPGDFFEGDTETIMLNFTAAKYLLHEWLKTHSLKKFIDAIDAGERFETAYSQK